MFGISPIKRLEAVLDRRVQIRSIDALSLALEQKGLISFSLERAAIGIDANVLLKLAAHKNSADIVDYMDTELSGPLIVPGQVIQEFWNNQLTAVDPVATGAKKKFDGLRSEFEKIDSGFADYGKKIVTLLDEYQSQYGHIYDGATIRNTLTVIDLFRKKGRLTYVPRSRLSEIAKNRKRTKTPPGFKDDGDGDFYVWAEFLYGLLLAKRDGISFDHAVFLTNDQKVDWSRAGVPHPILSAEVQALTGARFYVLTIEQLYAKISKAT